MLMCLGQPFKNQTILSDFQTIWHPDDFGPFKYQTNLVFRSLLNYSIFFQKIFLIPGSSYCPTQASFVDDEKDEEPVRVHPKDGERHQRGKVVHYNEVTLISLFF
jgi:hypothetical protein